MMMMTTLTDLTAAKQPAAASAYPRAAILRPGAHKSHAFLQRLSVIAAVAMGILWLASCGAAAQLANQINANHPTSGSLTIVTSSLPSGTVAVPYGPVALVAQGGSAGGYSWSITTGQLPTGLTLTPATGVIDGTPTIDGQFSFTLTVADSGGASAQATFNIGIAAASSATLAILTTQLPIAVVNAPYGPVTLTAQGGTGQGYVWDVALGATLPAGLSLAAMGEIAGTPTATGVYAFDLTVTDSAMGTSQATVYLDVVPAGASTLDIVLSQPVLAIQGNPSAVSSLRYNNVASASGGTPGYTWSMQSPETWVTFDASNVKLILDIPARFSGHFDIDLTVTDSATPPETKTESLVIAIWLPGQPPQILSTVLPDATAGQFYRAPLIAFGGVTRTSVFGGSWADYQFGITNGSLPPPQSGAYFFLDPLGGQIIGIPAIPSGGQTWTFELEAIDFSHGLVPPQARQVTTATVTLYVRPTPLTILSGIGVPWPQLGHQPLIQTLPSATAGQSYSHTLGAGGGTAPYHWRLAGAPAWAMGGLSINPDTGELTGTPDSGDVGTSGVFQIIVTDSSAQAQTVSMDFTIGVSPAVALTILTASIVDGYQGQVYGMPLDAIGGSGSYTWSLAPGSGAPPGTVQVDPGTGYLYGSLAGVATGSHMFTVRVDDTSGANNQNLLTLTVLPPPAPPAIGDIVSFVGSSNGSAGLVGIGGIQARHAKLIGASGMAWDSAGNFYVTVGTQMSGGAYTGVRKVDAATGLLDMFIVMPTAADNVGDIVFDTNGVLHLSSMCSGVFYTWTPAAGLQPSISINALPLVSGMALGADGKIYMAQLGLGSAVFRMNSATMIRGRLWQSPLNALNSAGNASDVAFDPQGRLLVCDREEHLVWRLTLDGSGNVLTAEVIAGVQVFDTNGVLTGGVYGNMGDGGPAIAATIALPWSVTADAAGNVYITSQNGTTGSSIRKIDTAGNISTVATTNTPYSHVRIGPDEQLYFTTRFGVSKYILQ